MSTVSSQAALMVKLAEGRLASPVSLESRMRHRSVPGPCRALL